MGQVDWMHCGVHNASNAVAVVAACQAIGVAPDKACEALSRFPGVKRRMENWARQRVLLCLTILPTTPPP